MLHCKKILPCHFPFGIAIAITSKGTFRTSAVIDSHFLITKPDILLIYANIIYFALKLCNINSVI